jgi:hypothetical protein
MKVNREKLLGAYIYIKKINMTDFDDLDFSEFPEYKDIPLKEKENVKFLGLSNKYFIMEHLMGERKEKGK